MNKKEVVITWPIVILIVVMVFLVASVIIGIVMGFYTASTKSTPQITPSITATTLLTDDLAQEFAESIAVAYFTVDFNQADKWVDSFAPYTDDGSYKDIKSYYQPLLWPILTNGNVNSKATLVSSEKRGSAIDKITNTEWQIWTVKVNLDSSWPSFPESVPTILFVPWPEGNTSSVNILLLQKGEEWKFAMFLNEKSVNSMIGASQK